MVRALFSPTFIPCSTPLPLGRAPNQVPGAWGDVASLFAYSCRHDDAIASAAVANRTTIDSHVGGKGDGDPPLASSLTSSAVARPTKWTVVVERPHYVLVDDELNAESSAIIARCRIQLENAKIATLKLPWVPMERPKIE